MDDFLKHVNGLTNLKVFNFDAESRELILIQVQGLKDLVPVCKKLNKIELFVTIDNFDLWQTFRHFDTIKELNISCYGLGSVLIDTKTRIRQLLTLKTLRIRCKSIGNNFFSDIKQFSPNLGVLSVFIRRPRYQFSNQHLIALSECKQIKVLKIRFPPITIENNIEYPIVDDIGLIPLIDNCKQLKRIAFEFRVDSIIDSLIKWIEVLSDSSKRSIIFQTCLSKEHIETILSNMSRLENFKCFRVTNNINCPLSRYYESIQVSFDKSKTISILMSANWYSNKRIDCLFRYKDLQRLELSITFSDLDISMLNIEPLMELKEITLECNTIDKHFFDNITKLAPNVEELELKSLFKLTNDNMITLSQLKCLTRICLVSTKKNDHSVDDVGVIKVLHNCQKLREVILNLQLNITSASIDKLKEVANRIINSERPKDMIRFECFVSSPELQTNRLKSLPKNLIIKTKFLLYQSN